MAFVFPVVQDPATQQHRPNGPDVLDPTSLPVATNVDYGITTYAPPAEAIAGVLNNKAVTPFDLASVIATLQDLRITAMTFNAATGVLTLTRSDGALLTITLTDVEVATTTPPPVSDNPAIPTDHYGTNAEYLGAPDGWFLINGKKVPFYN